MSALLRAAPFAPLRTGAIVTLATAILAVQAVEAGLLPYRAFEDPVVATGPDPVLVRVGAGEVRLSDLRAQAGPALAAASTDDLVRDGYLDDAAQQLALAQAAEADGLAETLEVRAALALARRRVLSEAYLDLAVSRGVTDEAVRRAYEAELRAARDHDRASVRHVLTATEEAAAAARRRLERGERFGRVARALSQDADTREAGGSFGLVHPDELPRELRAAASSAPVGELVGPVRSEAGWHVFRVDARRRLAVPTLEARAPTIRAALRAEAMRQAAERAGAAARVSPVVRGAAVDAEGTMADRAVDDVREEPSPPDRPSPRAEL